MGNKEQGIGGRRRESGNALCDGMGAERQNTDGNGNRENMMMSERNIEGNWCRESNIRAEDEKERNENINNDLFIVKVGFYSRKDK